MIKHPLPVTMPMPRDPEFLTPSDVTETGLCPRFNVVEYVVVGVFAPTSFYDNKTARVWILVTPSRKPVA